MHNSNKSESLNKDTKNQINPLKATLSNSDDFFNNGEIAKALLNSGQRDLLLLSNEDGNPEYFFGMYQTFSQMLLENRGIIFKREAYRSFKDLPGSIKNASQAQEQLLKVLPKTKLFKGLNHQDILKITKNVQFKRFTKDEIVFNKGELSTEVFVLITGGINLYNDDTPTGYLSSSHITSISKSGSILGELAPFTKENRSAKGVAMDSDTVLLSFQIREDEGLEKILNHLYKNVIIAISNKLRDMNQKI